MWHIPLFADNVIDGESFLELSEDDIKEIVKPIGIVKKILKLQVCSARLFIILHLILRFVLIFATFYHVVIAQGCSTGTIRSFSI